LKFWQSLLPSMKAHHGDRAKLIERKRNRINQENKDAMHIRKKTRQVNESSGKRKSSFRERQQRFPKPC